jgi:hypothetical protein
MPTPLLGWPIGGNPCLVGVVKHVDASLSAACRCQVGRFSARERCADDTVRHEGREVTIDEGPIYHEESRREALEARAMRRRRRGWLHALAAIVVVIGWIVTVSIWGAEWQVEAVVSLLLLTAIAVADNTNKG